MKYILYLLLTSCTSFVYGKEMQTEDCVTRHLKIVSHKETPTTDMYEKIVDMCKSMYSGRP